MTDAVPRTHQQRSGRLLLILWINQSVNQSIKHKHELYVDKREIHHKRVELIYDVGIQNWNVHKGMVGRHCK